MPTALTAIKTLSGGSTVPVPLNLVEDNIGSLNPATGLSLSIKTAFAEGAALTGAAGDASFVMGLGSVAANAGDAALTGTEVDFGAVTGTIDANSTISVTGTISVVGLLMGDD